MTSYAASVFVFACAVVACFQAALLLGMPWSEFTCGRRWRGRLPWLARIISLLSILLLALSSLIIPARVRALPEFHARSHLGAWIAVGYRHP